MKIVEFFYKFAALIFKRIGYYQIHAFGYFQMCASMYELEQYDFTENNLKKLRCELLSVKNFGLVLVLLQNEIKIVLAKFILSERKKMIHIN